MGEPEPRSNVPRVFISSTCEDLKPYRDAAREASIGAEMLPTMSEYFVASGERPPLDACLSKVSQSNVLVVIVAHRYGWVPPDQPTEEDKSVTWLECERAVSNGAEVLAFLVDEAGTWPEPYKEQNRIAAAILEGKATNKLLAEVKRNVKRLGEFREWLKKRAIRVAFTSPEDLRGKVSDALRVWRKRHPEFELPEASFSKEFDPEKYLRSQMASTCYIDIRGLQVGTGNVHRFPIEDLFISLTTTIRPDSTEGKTHRKLATTGEIAADDERIMHTRDVPLHDAMSQPRLVIVGDPGAGKTTFLRRVTFALCQTRLGDVPEAAEARLGIGDRTFPVFVRLADLAQHIARFHKSESAPASDDAPAWLPHFLGALSKDSSWDLDTEFFRRQLEGGSCTVLLDGLDEAPDRVARGSLSQFIQNAAGTYDQCRFVVTSRPAAYTDEAVVPEFAHARIEPLSDDAIETFLSSWCKALYVESESAAEKHCGELLAALRMRPDIRRMARNPVMLTALAVVHWNERRLPEQRADLYESIIRWLSRSRKQRPGRPTAERSVSLLQELALCMQNHSKGRQVKVPQRWAAEAIAGEFEAGQVTRGSIQRAATFLDAEELDSGIIVGRGNDLQFWHLTFQEFLSAKAIAGRPEAEQHQLLCDQTHKPYLPAWREVMLLLAGVLHQQGRAKVDGLVGKVLDELGDEPELDSQARCAGLLGAVFRDLEPVDYNPADVRYEALLDNVMAVFDSVRSQAVPIEVRMAAADALGQAGDPRLDRNSSNRWVSIPAGEFLMGSQTTDDSKPNFDQEAYDEESPVHEVHLDAFQIGRYPVTVTEYRQFVEHGGYNEEQWWTAGGFERFAEPDDWQDQLEFPNRPVVGVSWFEAAAYAAWAGVRLPTEAEWERAARGTESRKFPWGNDAAEPSRLNYDQNVGHVTPVGIYPIGATPDGIQDMAGNVWEWCQDWFGQDYYANGTSHSPVGPEKGEYRVLRGGSWNYVARSCRAAYRFRFSPVNRYYVVGFRVLL